MHSVTNQPQPEFLRRNQQGGNEFEKKYRDRSGIVWDFGPTDRPSCSVPPVDSHTRIRDYKNLIKALASQFNGPHPDATRKLLGVCGYCERTCEDRPGQSQNEVDHFRPRNPYTHLTFVWANLMYVFRRCNRIKDDGRFANEVDTGGFVNPREPGAEEYFAYDLTTGAMIVHPSLCDADKIAKAQRTIEVLGLDKEDINSLRRHHLDLVLKLYKRKRRKLSLYKRRKVQFSSLIIYADGANYFSD